MLSTVFLLCGIAYALVLLSAIAVTYFVPYTEKGDGYDTIPLDELLRLLDAQD